MLKSFKIYTCTNGTLGLHLSRAPWDPYPWVSSIQKDSTSYQAGLRIGDCLLELNGQDVLGLKISEIAALLKNHWLNESSNHVNVVIWRNKYNSNSNVSGVNASTNDCKGNIIGREDVNHVDDDDYDEDEENNAHNINQQSLQKFATCLQHIAQLLECPVCLEVIKPPGWQCCNGHVLCNNCRSRSEKCPVCRVPLGPRGRCLLSDKLFTLLADSFPCDGVRSNKNSPRDRRKCSTEFHNQPKMAIAQKHQQQQQEKDEQQGVKKAKDFLFTSLRHHRRKMLNSKMSHDDNNVDGHAGEMKEEYEHPSMQKLSMYDTNSVVGGTSFERHSSNRKSRADYKNDAADQVSEANIEGVATTFYHNELQRQTSTVQQCHCITCFQSDRVAIVNNVTMTNTTEAATLNKYILRIPSQGQLAENMIQQKQQQSEEKFQSFQCPTGKLCCLNVNVLPPPTTCTNASRGLNSNTESMTNNNLSTRTTTTTATPKQTKANLKQTVLMTEQQHQFNSYKFQRILKNEWEVLAHLTEDHKLPVYQYYAEFGQRIPVQCLSQQHSIACLNIRGTDEQVTKVEKFFLACIPLEMTNTTTTNYKVAIFLYHLNTNINGNAANSTCLPIDEISNFETIIENPLTGVKWFGRAHPLTTQWSDILEKQHFLRHNVSQNNLVAVSVNEAALRCGDDAFVIVIKRK